MFNSQISSDNQQTREKLYCGEIFLLKETTASLKLVNETHQLISEIFQKNSNLRLAQFEMEDEAFFQKIGAIRKKLFLEPYFHKLVYEVIEAYHFEPDKIAFDPVRLRVVTHKGHEKERAASVYYAHRDTWYAHSQSIITWWIPLDDLTEEETFVFYPSYFEQTIQNDSERFNYDEWVKEGWNLKIGWQHFNSGIQIQYPSALEKPQSGKEVGFSCKKGQNLLFSGSHLHQTRKQALEKTRFSLDFRIVHLEDHQNSKGAPNTDNRSSGSALVDYIKPNSF